MEPDDIAGLVLWLKADAITGLSDGDPVATWEDSSTANNDGTGVAGANAPTYETNELNGLPVVRLNNSSNVTTTLTQTNPFSIFYVTQCDNIAGSKRAVNGVSANWLLGPYSGAWDWYSGGFATSAKAAVTNEWIIHGVRQDSSTGTHFVYELTNLNAPTTGTRASPGEIGQVGLGNVSIFGEGYAGDFAEVIVYDNVVSDSDRDAIVSYLRVKWGGLSDEQALSGTLFENTPTFFAGSVIQGILEGTLFVNTPAFFAGEIVGGDKFLDGELFTNQPTFFSGTMTGGFVTLPPTISAGSLRVEVWSLPDDPAGFRLLCEPPFLNGTSFQDRADVYGGGQLIVPAAYEHLDLIVQVDPSDITTSHSSIIRGLQYWGEADGWVVVWEFFADEADEDITKEGQRVVVISGLDVRAAPDDGIVYPRQPTSPHWEWGAPTMLENAGFEDSGFTNFKIHLFLEDSVTAGTWNIEFDDGATTDDVTLNWDTDLPAAQTGIEGLDNVVDIAIAGEGTETNPWVIEVLDPAGTDFNVTIDSSGLTGGAALHLAQMQGGAGVVEPWTRAFNPATGLFHGFYTNFQVSTTHAHTGTSSLYVKGSLGAWADSWPGAQQIVSVGEGEHWAAIWVYPLFNARYRFVLRTLDETLIAYTEADLTANSWQELRLEAINVPLYVGQIIFRISCISNTPNDHEFYIDDGMFAPGFPASTWGDILSILMNQAFTRGTLDWLDLGFDAALDSDGVAWDTDEFAFQADALMRLGSHVIADGEAAGYEHDVVPIDPPGAQTHTLHAYNPLGRGDTSFQAAVVGSFNAARVAKRRVPYTHLLLELNDGTHVEVADARLSGFGRRERGVRVEQATDPFTATKIGEAIFDKEIVNLLATQITLSGDSVLPYRDFDIGWIVPHTLAQRALKHDRRIQVITSAYSQNRWVYVVTAGGVE